MASRIAIGAAIASSIAISIFILIIVWIASSGYYDVQSASNDLMNEIKNRNPPKPTDEECERLNQLYDDFLEAKGKLVDQNPDLAHSIEGFLNPSITELFLYITNEDNCP